MTLPVNGASLETLGLPREKRSLISSDILLDLNIIISNGTLSQEELKSVIFLGCNNPLTFNIENTNIICFIVMYYIFSTRNSGRFYNTSKLKQFIFHHTEKLNKPLFKEYEHES